MKFTYKIRGRKPGYFDDVIYQGKVEAANHKSAALLALGAEFGDPDDGSPYDQLVDSGWCDEIDFDDWFDFLTDDQTNSELLAGEHSYDIEITSYDSMTEIPMSIKRRESYLSGTYGEEV